MADLGTSGKVKSIKRIRAKYANLMGMPNLETEIDISLGPAFLFALSSSQRSENYSDLCHNFCNWII